MRRTKWRILSASERSLIYLLIVGCTIIVLSPFIWLILTSVKPYVEMFTVPPQLPQHPIISNYIDILLRKGMSNNFLNTLIVAFSSTFTSLLLGSIAAYGFARFPFIARRSLFFFVLFTRMVPRIVIVIPIYLLFRMLGLLDTRVVLVVMYVTMQLPLVVWIMVSFFEELPKELEEAASIDGCSVLQTLATIVLPLAKPGLAVAATLSFIESWNEFLLALILTRNVATTVPVALAQSITGWRIYWGPLSAGGVLFTIPVLIFSLLAQKHIVRGMTFGAVKK